MVERFVRDEEAVGSSPVTSTNKEAVAANAAAASFIFMSCFIVDISLKKIPQVKRERLRFIIELMRAGFTEDTKVNMISATGSIRTAMNAISVLLLRDGCGRCFYRPAQHFGSYLILSTNKTIDKKLSIILRIWIMLNFLSIERLKISMNYTNII